MDRQINRADWPAFADEFSQSNQGRPISIEIVGQTLGDEMMAEETALVALDFDPQGQGTILITVGQGESVMTHTIAAPETIWLRSDQGGVAIAMEIIVRDTHQKTILRFENVESQSG
jgi:hypothetical protein